MATKPKPIRKKRSDTVIKQPIIPQSKARFPVVGIGASAGGLEAVEGFFKAMPDDSGIAFVLLRASTNHDLCSNATHAMEEHGGSLAVGLHKTKLSVNEVGTDPNIQSGAYLRLSVSDTGHGMTPEIIDKIFDPSFTTKKFHEGSGMGLSVVYGIVRNHNGFIQVESKPGKGSVFNAYFPWIKEKIVSTEVTPSEEIPTGNEKILIVDDLEMLTDIGKLMLENLGYSVTAQNDSSEALELFISDPDQFDLVITDKIMPTYTGSELAKHFLKKRSDIPIILCTGFSAFIDEMKAKEIGIKAFVMKPVTINVMSKLSEKFWMVRALSPEKRRK